MGGDDRAGVPEQFTPVARWSKRASLPDEEIATHLLLETLDLPADRGLADPEIFGCSRHSSEVEDSTERAE